MGTRRTPFLPVISTMASQAWRVEAESAEVTPLQVLPPMVPALRIWGPPTMSTASPRTLIYSWIRGSRGDVAEAGETADAEVLLLIQGHAPHFVGIRWMEMSAFPARLPSRICTSTSVPPAMIWASGCSSRRADGVLDALRLVERFHIIHSRYFLLQSWIRPVFLEGAGRGRGA